MSRARWKISYEQSGILPRIGPQLGGLLQELAEIARAEWAKVARSRLRSTAREYISNIGPPEIGRKQVVIRLFGKLPNMLEEGSPPFDLKPGLLKSRSARRDKRGRPYVRVPFGLKVPGGRVVGSSPPVMPKGVYSLASKLKVGESVKLTKRYESYGIRTRLSPDITKWGHYTWKTSPFAGVTKVRRYPGESPRTKTGQLISYKTFRTVSRRSDPGSWIHPGFRGINAMDDAARAVEQAFQEVMAKVG